MLMIPLPFVATAFLLALTALTLRANPASSQARWFAAVIALYALQSVLTGARWGYELTALSPWITATAALIPAAAWTAYTQMIRRWRSIDLMHITPPVLIWLLLLVARDTVDPALIALYLGYGAALLWRAGQGADHLALARIDGIVGSHRALWVTGALLIASALVDIFIVADFIRTGGRNVGAVIVMAQMASVICVGIAAVVASDGVSQTAPQKAAQPAPHDPDIADRIARLFTHDKLHRDLDLNLRRIARRLAMPDRAVSNAINRTHGVSVSQYVNNFRVAEAQHLLATTDQPVIQIGLAAGFLTKSNFNREFQRVTGQSPSQYRASQA